MANEEICPHVALLAAMLTHTIFVHCEQYVQSILHLTATCDISLICTWHDFFVKLSQLKPSMYNKLNYFQE